MLLNLIGTNNLFIFLKINLPKMEHCNFNHSNKTIFFCVFVSIFQAKKLFISKPSHLNYILAFSFIENNSLKLDVSSFEKVEVCLCHFAVQQFQIEEFQGH